MMVEKLENPAGRIIDTEPQRGIIKVLFQARGFGFIEREDGGEIFFHASGVIEPRFEDLKESMTVGFYETESMKTQKTRAIRSEPDQVC